MNDALRSDIYLGATMLVHCRWAKLEMSFHDFKTGSQAEVATNQESGVHQREG